jgi:hypothetical protein
MFQTKCPKEHVVRQGMVSETEAVREGGKTKENRDECGEIIT